MTKFLRNDSGDFSAWAKTLLIAISVGLGGFCLSASAKVWYGAPVEAKFQDGMNREAKERLLALEQKMAVMDAKLDTILQYQINRNLRDRREANAH